MQNEWQRFIREPRLNLPRRPGALLRGPRSRRDIGTGTDPDPGEYEVGYVCGDNVLVPEYVGMNSHEVVRIVGWIDRHEVCYQINGGWAVDALIGRQTRAHRDLDLFVDATAVADLLSWLRSEGYVEEVDELPARVELRRDQQRVDVHPMTLDSAANGTQWNAAGEAIYWHPAETRTTAEINGHSVCVATAARLEELRQGYPPREEDLHDLELLSQL